MSLLLCSARWRGGFRMDTAEGSLRGTAPLLDPTTLCTISACVTNLCTALHMLADMVQCQSYNRSCNWLISLILPHGPRIASSHVSAFSRRAIRSDDGHARTAELRRG
jgi:hypothetical protein